MQNLDLDNIPEGIWIRREDETIILGSNRAPLSLSNYFTIAIGLGFSSLICLPILTPLDWLKLVIGFIAFFIGISILITELGDVEFRLKIQEGSFFQGKGKLGYKYKLIYSEIDQFEAIRKNFGYDLVIKGKQTVKYGLNLNQENMLFALEVLNAFIENPAAVRNQLSPDHLRHLIK